MLKVCRLDIVHNCCNSACIPDALLVAFCKGAAEAHGKNNVSVKAAVTFLSSLNLHICCGVWQRRSGNELLRRLHPQRPAILQTGAKKEFRKRTIWRHGLHRLDSSSSVKLRSSCVIKHSAGETSSSAQPPSSSSSSHVREKPPSLLPPPLPSPRGAVCHSDWSPRRRGERGLIELI